MTLLPHSPVVVATPTGPFPCTLRALHAALQERRIAPRAAVQLDTGEVISAEVAVLSCAAFQPTRAGGAIALVLVGPTAIAALFSSLFGGGAAAAVVLLLGVAVVGGLVLATVDRLRTAPGIGSLTSPFGAAVGAASLLAVILGLATGIPERQRRALVTATTEADDPCVGVGDAKVERAFVSDTERATLARRRSQCAQARGAVRCKEVATILDAGKPLGPALAALRDGDGVFRGEPDAARIAEAVANHQLTAEDRALYGKLGCGDTLNAAFAKELARSPGAWKNGLPVLEPTALHAGKLTTDDAILLAAAMKSDDAFLKAVAENHPTAEVLAAAWAPASAAAVAALKKSDFEAIKAAALLCIRTEKLGPEPPAQPPRPSACAAVRRRAKQTLEAKDARCAALLAQRERCEARCSDASGFFTDHANDEAALDCDERCAKIAAGCE
jgi:hypothetical protein